MSQSYGYDRLNRVNSITEGAASREFTYDQYGNGWVSSNTVFPLDGSTPNTQSSYNANNNQLTYATYDPRGNGNQIQPVTGGFTFAYDGENRLTSVTLAGGSVPMVYEYDGEGRRIAKVVCPTTSLCTAATAGAVVTWYVYDAQGQLAAEYGSAAPSCTTCYLMADHLGSTRVVTDQAGALQECDDYLPFGEALGTADGRTGCYGASTTTTLKFTGKERGQNGEAGLDYFEARYFSGAQGRFTSPDDPLDYADPEDPQSWNLYAYGLNSPLVYADETGHDPCVKGVNPETGNLCVVGTARAPVDPWPVGGTVFSLLWNRMRMDAEAAARVAAAAASAAVAVQVQASQDFRNWIAQPRDTGCLYASTAAGAAGGAVAGAVGLVTGPGVVSTESGGALGGGVLGGIAGLGACMSNSGPSSGGGGGQSYGGHKSSTKWANQMAKRGWTEQQIEEAIASGKQFPAPNNVNPANGATRFVHPTTGRSVVIDNVTKEILHVGGDGFKYWAYDEDDLRTIAQ